MRTYHRPAFLAPLLTLAFLLAAAPSPASAEDNATTTAASSTTATGSSSTFMPALVGLLSSAVNGVPAATTAGASGSAYLKAVSGEWLACGVVWEIESNRSSERMGVCVDGMDAVRTGEWGLWSA